MFQFNVNRLCECRYFSSVASMSTRSLPVRALRKREQNHAKSKHMHATHDSAKHTHIIFNWNWPTTNWKHVVQCDRRIEERDSTGEWALSGEWEPQRMPLSMSLFSVAIGICFLPFEFRFTHIPIRCSAGCMVSRSSGATLRANGTRYALLLLLAAGCWLTARASDSGFLGRWTAPPAASYAWMNELSACVSMASSAGQPFHPCHQISVFV